MELSEISPAELIADVLVRLCSPDLAPAGIVVGPTSDAQQQAGVVSIMSAGLPVEDRYSPIQWMRAQIRCLDSTLDGADAIAQAVMRDLHGRVRTIGRMKSTDTRYLIHLCNITAGPSMHFDGPETWETLLFAEIMIGTDPVVPA